MRATDPLWQEIESEVEAILEAAGFELVTFEVFPSRGQGKLRIRMDKPGGVTIEDCVEMSNQIGAYLEVADPFPGPYLLEVSSPGVDRPLVKPRDFQRFQGRRARITFREPNGQQRTLVGTLAGWEEEQVLVAQAEETTRIPFAAIVRAHLKYEWEDEEAS